MDEIKLMRRPPVEAWEKVKSLCAKVNDPASSALALLVVGDRLANHAKQLEAASRELLASLVMWDSVNAERTGRAMDALRALLENKS